GFEAEEGRAVLERTARAARAASDLGAPRDTAIFSAAPLTLDFPDERSEGFDRISLEALTAGLLEEHERARALSAELRVQTTVNVQREDWRVRRSDGTDASWTVPRLVLNHAITAEGPAGSVTVRTHLFAADYHALSRPESARLLAARAASATR